MAASALLLSLALPSCTASSDESTPALSVPAGYCGRSEALPPGGLACNGSPDLCDQPFDRVVFPMTHNATSSLEYDFQPAIANQHKGLAAQLADGVRGLMLDTYYYDGERVQSDSRLDGLPIEDQVYFCHGACQLGHRRAALDFCELVRFLDSYPDEVVSIIFESSVAAADMAELLEVTGLTDYAFAYEGTWPTLAEMINSRRRLVLFAESGGGDPPYYHEAWSLIWDTPYDFSDPSEFTCSLNRGSPANPLFLMNHWLSDPLPQAERAAESNAYEVLMERAQTCASEAGRKPTFIGVDFYDVGDLTRVVNELNGN